MQDAPNSFDNPLVGLSKGEWLESLAKIADDHGHFQPLGKRHFATFVEEKPTLLVTFETVNDIRSQSDTAQPMGWELVKALNWSHLGIISNGDTWFREKRIFGYFDRLSDDGFFEDFDKVIFYGAGACGYAAAAYSIAAPGATVVVVQPQATLDPSVAGWDDRFTKMRRTSFTNRYGYAPDMLDAANSAYVIYDPEIKLDAMHAALFTRPNVTKLEIRYMGDAIQTDFIEMQLLFRILAKAGTGKLNQKSFSRLMRARRDYPPYLRRLMEALDDRNRPALTRALCRNVVARLDNAPRFRRRLSELTNKGQ